MNTTQRPDVRLPGYGWALIFGIRVMDPDGWRTDKVSFHDAPILYPDFLKRVCQSTVRDVSYVAALPKVSSGREAIRVVARQRHVSVDGGAFLLMSGGPEDKQVIGWSPGTACVFFERSGWKARTHLYEPRPKEGRAYYLGATCWVDLSTSATDADGSPLPRDVQRMCRDLKTQEEQMAHATRRWSTGFAEIQRLYGARVKVRRDVVVVIAPEKPMTTGAARKALRVLDEAVAKAAFSADADRVLTVQPAPAGTGTRIYVDRVAPTFPRVAGRPVRPPVVGKQVPWKDDES